MSFSAAERVARSGDQGVETFLRHLSTREQDQLAHTWREWWARPEQVEPPGSWRVWALITGRGWGKNRTISEWVHEQAEKQPGSHGGLVARTTSDVRDTVILSISGIINTQKPWNPVEYYPSTRLLTWANGTTALTFSSEEPAQLRGPNLNWAVADEWATWKKIQDKNGGTAWTNLQLATRVVGPRGVEPRILLATTPRPIADLIKLLERDNVAVTRGTMHDNASNLSQSFIDDIEDQYAGTRLGRQEIDGEILPVFEGALVTQDMINAARLPSIPPSVQLTRGGVGVDPAVSVTERSDNTGIVPASLGADGHLYVFPPRSGKFTPDGWARRVVETRDAHSLDFIVAERNQGGDLVRHTIRTVEPNAMVYDVVAKKGKHVRFEPVAALYEQGKIHHVGDPRMFAKLEEQVCSFTEVGYEGNDSPDDADALVWVAYKLAVRPQRNFQIW